MKIQVTVNNSNSHFFIELLNNLNNGIIEQYHIIDDNALYNRLSNRLKETQSGEHTILENNDDIARHIKKIS
jgi:hypothetical protein